MLYFMDCEQIVNKITNYRNEKILARKRCYKLKWKDRHVSQG